MPNKLLDRIKKQNFGKNDSVIASTIMHPLNALMRGEDWFNDQVSTGLGYADPSEDNLYPGYAFGNKQAGAALNLAGLMQAGSMPAAPLSSGGTLGTAAMPYIGTLSRYDIPVGASLERSPYIGTLSRAEMRKLPTYPTQDKNVRKRR